MLSATITSLMMVLMFGLSYGGNIQVQTGDGSSEWWYQMNLFNVDASKVKEVYISDSVYPNSWTLGQQQNYDPYPWFFDFNGRARSTPLNVKIVSTSGETLIKHNLITRYDIGATYDFGSNFVASGGNGGSSNNGYVEIKNGENNNDWWHSLTIENLESSVKVSKVYLKNSENNWLEGKITWWNSNMYEFKFGEWTGKQWNLPYHVKIITTDGQEMVKYNVIQNRNNWYSFSMGKQFDKVTYGGSNNNNGNDNSVTVSSADGCNTWWYGLRINNVDSSLTVSKVYLSDSQNSGWLEGQRTNWDSTVWEFEFGHKTNRQWYVPYNIKIVASNGKVIEKYNLITSYYGTFDTNENFNDNIIQRRRRLLNYA
jgi:hypothetical protein